MPKINQLDFAVANLIAAGEVVERPASVVKELLENAIDAGATKITAEIRRGGITLIRVADDGCGMEGEDMPVALRRHATSKIATAEDLDGIATLGFRGEALAAISAVSAVTLISKTRESAVGTVLTAQDGTVTGISEVGCADGTTVTVENLFENVPARRKFLKKDATEAQAVAAVAEKIAMSRPDIALRFISDGVTRFSTVGDGDIAHTLYALYGREFATRLIAVSGEVGGVRVTGYIGRPDNARPNRNYQNTFINGRYVRSKTVQAATERAFTSYMAPEKFPVAVLYLTVSDFAVDVNVHPAKLEVKFTDERAVFEAVYYAVREALESNTDRPAFAVGGAKDNTRKLTQTYEAPGKAEQIRIPAPVRPAPLRPEEHIAPPSAHPAAPARENPSFTLSPKKSVEVLETVHAAIDFDAVPKRFSPPAEESKPTPVERTLTPERTQSKENPSAPEPSAPGAGKIPAAAIAPELPSYRILGVAFRCYILVELDGEKMMVIDQHAAHERILFEQLKKSREADDRILSVGLLVPLSVSLSPEEYAAAEEYGKELSALGFAYQLTDGKAVLTAVPDAITLSDAEDLFVRMCGEMQSGASSAAVTEQARREKLLYQIACKAAIKGGRTYDEAHIEYLVKEVLSLPDVTVCPHGRPIAFYLTKKELDRQFDRIK